MLPKKAGAYHNIVWSMDLREFIIKKRLNEQQAEQLNEHLNIITDAIADYIIKHNFFTNDSNDSGLCEEQANKRKSTEQ